MKAQRTNLEVRDVREEDKEELFEMIEDFYNRSGACLHGMNQTYTERTFQLCLTENPYARMLILESEGEKAGFLLLSFTWSNEAGGLTVLVEELYLKPETRGKGLGKKALQWLGEAYPQARRFRLEVTSGNTGAIALYEKQGYEQLNYEQMIKDRP